MNCEKHKDVHFEKCPHCHTDRLKKETNEYKRAYEDSCKRIDVLLFELSRVITEVGILRGNKNE